MMLSFAHKTFQSAPTFESALNSENHTDQNLLIIGRLICEKGLENKIGVALLHRHFSIRDTEVILRVTLDKRSFSFVASQPSADVQACAWAVNGYDLSPIEYLVTSDDIVIPNSSLAKIAHEMVRYDLGGTYSLIYLPAFPDPLAGDAVYEMTNERLRLSVISDHVSEEMRGRHFAKSAFAFDVFCGEVRIIPRTKCLPCLSCIATIEPVNEQKTRFIESNIFGSDVSLEGIEFQENLVTQEIIGQLHSRMK